MATFPPNKTNTELNTGRTTFPRKCYSNHSATLQEAGLTPNASMVARTQTQTQTETETETVTQNT